MLGPLRDSFDNFGGIGSIWRIGNIGDLVELVDRGGRIGRDLNRGKGEIRAYLYGRNYRCSNIQTDMKSM